MRSVKSWVLLGVALVSLLSASCGRTTLRGAYQTETDEGPRGYSGSGVSNGGVSVGTAGLAGFFGSGGFGAEMSGSGFGGTFPLIEGGTNVGGTPLPLGGEPGVCNLSVQDCASSREPGCGDNAKCSGSLLDHLRFDGDVHISVMATAPNSRVLIGGSYFGDVDFGGQHLVSEHISDGHDWGEPFVAVYDSGGKLEWAYAYKGDGSWVTGAAFAPNGDVVAQGALLVESAGQASAFVVRLDAKGQERWNQPWGVDEFLAPHRLAVSNDDLTWLLGDYSSTVHLDAVSLPALGQLETSGFLLALDAQGKAVRARQVLPQGYRYVATDEVVVDDEDNVLVVGHGRNASDAKASFLQKSSREGEDIFQRDFVELRTPTLAVDRHMRIALAGSFGFVFENEGQTLMNADAGPDVWVGVYEREGELAWQKQLVSSGAFSEPELVATDPFGNLIVGGHGTRLSLASVDLQPQQSTEFGYLLKLRPNGDEVWARQLDGDVRFNAIATNTSGQIWAAGSFATRIAVDRVELVNVGDPNSVLLRFAP